MKILRDRLLCIALFSSGVACVDSPAAMETEADESSSGSGGTGTRPPPVTVTASGVDGTRGGVDTGTAPDPTTSTSADATGADTTASGTTEAGSSTTMGVEATETGSSTTMGVGATETGSSTTEVGVEDDTIYDIQDGTIATGVDVDVRGVVVTGVSNQGMFVQEPAGGQYSGVYVYLGAEPTVARGDEVDIVGVSEEFNDLTEIDATDGVVTPTGVTDLELEPMVVAPADIAPEAGEPWEGVLVRVEGEPLTIVSLPGFSEFEVNDGGPVDARIDNFLYNVFDAPASYPGFGIGASFTAIEGPLNFTFEQFKVAPREEADLEGYMGAAMVVVAYGPLRVLDDPPALP